MCYIECPCHGCKERSAGCHGWCEAYREFQRKNDEVKRRIRLEAAKNEWARHG